MIIKSNKKKKCLLNQKLIEIQLCKVNYHNLISINIYKHIQITKDNLLHKNIKFKNLNKKLKKITKIKKNSKEINTLIYF